MTSWTMCDVREREVERRASGVARQLLLGLLLVGGSLVGGSALGREHGNNCTENICSTRTLLNPDLP